MGYRSQVVYAIEPHEKGRGEWAMFIAEAKAKPETQQAMSMILDDCKDIEYPYWEGGLDSENESILITFDDVKWYDSFDEVQSFTALLDLAESYEDERINAAYVRIGEEEGDVETRYVNEGYELVRAYSFYEVDGSRFNPANVDTLRQKKVSLENKEIKPFDVKPNDTYDLKQIAKVWQECYGEDITKEYEGFITKLKEVDNDEL